MASSRRGFLRLSAGVAGLGGLSAASGCGAFGTSKNSSDKLTLWYWNRSIDDGLLAESPKKISGLKLDAQKIGGSYKPALLTTLAGRASVPDIACINSDIATYFPDSDQFVNLYDHGAKQYESLYLPWKWKQGVTPEGRMIGFPMDTGPTALMYRRDVFAKAGLPQDPGAVSQRVKTWDDYLEVGSVLKSKIPGTVLVGTISTIYGQMVAQLARQYSGPDGRMLADLSGVKNAWDTAVKAKKMGLSLGSAENQPDWFAGMTNGKIATTVGAVWEAFIMLDGAGSTSGKWHCCRAPGGAGNSGGSFMSVTKYCSDPALAFKLIAWLQSPANQVKSYTDIQLFPSAISSLSDPAMDKPDPFFGGQRTVDVWGTSAKNVKPALLGPYDSLISTPITTELTNVENAGKDPNRAWDDALALARKQLKHAGVE